MKRFPLGAAFLNILLVQPCLAADIYKILYVDARAYTSQPTSYAITTTILQTDTANVWTCAFSWTTTQLPWLGSRHQCTQVTYYGPTQIPLANEAKGIAIDNNGIINIPGMVFINNANKSVVACAAIGSIDGKLQCATANLP
jgi:hypothetical protein